MEDCVYIRSIEQKHNSARNRTQFLQGFELLRNELPQIPIMVCHP